MRNKTMIKQPRIEAICFYATEGVKLDNYNRQYYHDFTVKSNKSIWKDGKK